jgi:energy-coupling factor transporter ATP-binding protein EcfA2
VARPPLLVVDEPSTGLDYRETLMVMGLLDAYRREGGTVIIITHDVEIATAFADRIVVMANGRIIHDGPASTVHEHLERLREAAIILPDVVQIVRRLNLPASLRTIRQVAAAIAA